MALKTGDEYLKSLDSLKLEAHMLGQKSDQLGGHGLVSPSRQAVAYTFDAAHDAGTQELFCVESSLCGDTINRFSHLHQSADDLVNKVRMQRYCGISTACCFQRCVGMDAANAIYSTTYDCDQKHGTDYHGRFKEYWQWVQQNDLVVDGAMTDPKGDRGKRPKDQLDPDLFLRIKERRDNGVVISGAKLHQTGMLNSHEILVMPTLTMRPGEEAWAVCCAVPTDADGIRYIYGRQTSDTRKLEANRLDVGNPTFGGQEVMTVFEDVFVPDERVFLDGEVDFSGILVERFASYHRQSYGGCKVGVGDALIGATALIAQMNGVAGASHIKDKLAEMMHLTETIYSGSVSCSAMGFKTDSGAYYPDPLLANCTKQNVSRVVYEIARLAHDIAGGILATMPSERDLVHPEIGQYVKKFMVGIEGVSPENRMRVLRLIENMTGGTALVESMHGAGSPQTQKVMYARLGKLDMKKNLAKKLARVEE